MRISAPAIVCSSRHHGETAAIARLLTAEHGLIAGYVAGGRGRQMRPVLIPGNRVSAEFTARTENQLPFARLELVESRGPWLSEPLPAAAITWVTALTALALPERHPYPPLYEALAALLDAICMAPSARGWAMPLLSYEVLLMREMGYGGPMRRPAGNGEREGWAEVLASFDAVGQQVERYALADRHRDVMAAREQLRARLARIDGD